MDSGQHVLVHQALHGYRDGHELLASSTDLDSRSRRLLLGLSDLAGDPTTGFETYLTGYPLQPAGQYALARTWYADEMPRPGCVWTHTLLISFADLARQPVLSELVSLFRRPPPDYEGATYRASLSCSVIDHETEEEGGDPVLDAPMRVEDGVIAALYGPSPGPLLLPAQSSRQFEDLILRVWAQQWPRLRRSMSFSTGGLSLRRIDGTPLDFQVTPENRWRSLARAAGQASVLLREPSSRAVPNVVVVSFGDQVHEAVPDWVRVAALDLGRTGTPLRTFLRTYGADVPGERQWFAKLVETYLRIQELHRASETADGLVDFLGRSFGDPRVAQRLKSTVLGPPKTDDDLLPDVDEVTRLKLLLTTKLVSAFDEADLQVATRVHAQVNVHSHFGLRFLAWLFEVDANDLGSRLQTEIAHRLSVRDLARIFQEDRNLFVSLVGRQPSLCMREDVWKQPREFQRSLFSSLQAQVDDSEAEAMVAAMLRAGSDVLVDDIEKQFLEPAVAAVLEVVADAQPCSLGRWRGLVTRHPAAAFAWVRERGDNIPIPVVLLIVDSISPHDELVRQQGSSFWLRHLRTVLQDSGSAHGVHVAAFGLSLGLSLSDDDAGHLSALTFQQVHDALMGSRLSWTAWRWLEPRVPSPDWYVLWDWDRAERLRRALVNRFVEAHWDPALLRQAVQSEDTRWRVVRYAKTTIAGQRLLTDSGL